MEHISLILVSLCLTHTSDKLHFKFVIYSVTYYQNLYYIITHRTVLRFLYNNIFLKKTQVEKKLSYELIPSTFSLK